MNTHAIQWALAQKTGYPAASLLLVHLANLADNDKTVQITNTEMASLMEVSLPTAIRAKAELRDGGYITAVNKRNEKGIFCAQFITLKPRT